MLSPVQYSFFYSYNQLQRFLHLYSCTLVIHNNSCLFELVLEPASLFLEDRKGTITGREKTHILCHISEF